MISGQCNCPAGECGYCQHVMALLFEIAEYSLKGLKIIPKEIPCTSRIRQWGNPLNVDQAPKAPVMNTTVQKLPSKRGISTTLYDPRKEQLAIDLYITS